MSAAYLVRGDARRLPLASASVQCVITSPPYFGLRSYGGQASVWGGDPDCPHTLADDPAVKAMTGGTAAASAKQVTNAGSQFGNAWVVETRATEQGNKRKPSDDGIDGRDRSTDKAAPKQVAVSTATCTHCGAWRGELGSEPTPALFVAHLVEVMRECWRVLRDDGVAFVNMGDSYAGSGKGPTGHNGIGDQTKRQGFRPGNPDKNHGNSNRDGLGGVSGTRSKSLLLVPERLALALSGFSAVPGAALVQMADELATAREAGDWHIVSAVESQLRIWAAMSAVFDGWIVRSRIAWCKAAPMPESAKDRPTSAWEHLWMLTKQGRYFWDHAAIQEPCSENTHDRGSGIGLKNATIEYDGLTKHNENYARAVNGAVSSRNPRNYWVLPPDPYPGAHFATFPREIPRRCILAATSEYGACAACGAPWRRVVERESSWPERKAAGGTAGNVGVSDTYQNGVHGTKRDHRLGGGAIQQRGWQPTCKCDPAAGVRPCVVLDPFSGSGTSCFVAASMGRIGIGVELSSEYTEQARLGRLAQQFLPLAPEAPAPAALALAAATARQGGMFEEVGA